MPDLNVPTPTLTFEGPAPGLAVLEKPISLACTAVIFPDGTPFEMTDLGTAGFFAYRQTAALTPIEIWDDGSKTWKPEASTPLATLKPTPLISKPGDPAPWQGLLVAAGAKDAGGNPQYGKQSGPPPGFPAYFWRAFFAGTFNNSLITGLSAPSATVRFVGVLDALRAGLRVPEGQTPENATEITLFVANAALQVIGSVLIRNESGLARIEISNQNGGGAILRLLPNGDIELQPAPGRSVIVNGATNADRIFYQPADAAGNPVGPKRWLP